MQHGEAASIGARRILAGAPVWLYRSAGTELLAVLDMGKTRTREDLYQVCFAQVGWILRFRVRVVVIEHASSGSG